MISIEWDRATLFQCGYATAGVDTILLGGSARWVLW